MSPEEQKRAYDEARRRGWDASQDIQEAIRQDHRDGSIAPRTVSSTQLLEAIADIELENSIKLNPNTSPEHKEWALAALERIRKSEAKNRELKKKK